MEKEEIISKQKDQSFIKSKYYSGDIVKYRNKFNVICEGEIDKLESREYEDRWLDSSHGCYRSSTETRIEYSIKGDWYPLSDILFQVKK